MTMSQSHRKLTYKPDPKGHCPRPFGLMAKKSGTIPEAITWKDFLIPTPFDQNDTGSCTGHGEAGALYASAAIANVPFDWVPSPKGIYTNARALERAAGAEWDRPLDSLSDDGAYPLYVQMAVREWGVRPIDLEGKKYHSDCTVENINEEPMMEDLEVSTDNRLYGEYGIQSFGSQRLYEIKRSLASGVMVAIGVQCDPAFMAYDGSKPISAPDNTALLGGHYMFAYGYKTDSKGRMVILFRNSWGIAWGMGGNAEGDESFIQGCSGIYAVGVQRK
jgi:hypothetical protein